MLRFGNFTYRLLCDEQRLRSPSPDQLQLRRDSLVRSEFYGIMLSKIQKKILN